MNFPGVSIRNLIFISLALVLAGDSPDILRPGLSIDLRKKIREIHIIKKMNMNGMFLPYH